MVNNPQNLSKKLFLSLKYLILLTFKVKNQKKIGHVFLGLFTWNHQYRHSHLANNGPALAVAYAEVTAVSDNVDIAVPVEFIASVETY